MAKVRVSVEVIEDLVFGFAPHPVTIRSMSADFDRGEVVFEIAGEDVPDAPTVLALMHLQQNRAGQRLCTQSFVAPQ